MFPLNKWLTWYSLLIKLILLIPKRRFLDLNLSVSYFTELEKNIGKSYFSEQFRMLINRYKRIRYNLDSMRQTACLLVNLVEGCAFLFYCTSVVRAQTQ